MTPPIDLVTGGAGFIGSHMVGRLVADGRRVRVVDDLSTGKLQRLDPLKDQIELVRADVAHAELTSLLRDVERVFHFAAIPSVPRSIRDPWASHESIASATLRLLIASRDAGVRVLVYSSSSSVYGNSTVSPKVESLPTAPIAPYGVAKLAGESYSRVFAALYGFRTVSLRYFNVFGPWQDETSAYAAVVPLFITRALQGQELTVNGDGSVTRDFTYVENVIEANLAAAAEAVPPGGVYNVAAGSPHSLSELIAELEAIIGRPIAVSYGPPRPGDIHHSHADISAAARDLDWRPSVPFGEGLRRTVEWYRSR